MVNSTSRDGRSLSFFFFQAEDGIRYYKVTGVQTCALPISCGERPIIFHARGGSIPRGGGRIDPLIKAAPAGAVNGTLRLREQGETVKQGYGDRKSVV